MKKDVIQQSTSLDVLVEKLVASITNSPTEWSVGEYSTKHAPTGISLWTGNGEVSCGVYTPIEIKGDTLTAEQRKKLWAAIQVLAITRTTAMIDAGKVVDQLDGKK